MMILKPDMHINKINSYWSWSPISLYIYLSTIITDLWDHLKTGWQQLYDATEVAPQAVDSQ